MDHPPKNSKLSSKIEIWENPGPDQGWSWIIALSCMLVNLCTNGLLRSQGLLYLATIDYNVSREVASWPYSLCIASASFSGISVSILAQIWSPRQIMFATGFFVSLGHVLCFFSSGSNIMWITICYGVISGIGTGFVTPTLALIINQYFNKDKATANGVSLAGITCGAFVFPNLTNILLEKYGLRGTFLVLGGCALNVLVGASFLRPRNKTQFKVLTNYDKTTCEIEKKNEQNLQNEHLLAKEYDSGNKYIPAGDIARCSVKHTPSSDDLARCSIKHTCSVENLSKADDNHLTTKDDCTTPLKNQSNFESEDKCPKIKQTEPLIKKTSILNDDRVEIRLSQKINNITDFSSRLFHQLADTVFDPMFTIVALSALSSVLVLMIFAMIIVDHAVDTGMPRNRASMLLMVFSLPDLVGRLSTGWVSDKGYAKRKNIFMFTKTIAGIIIIVLPSVRNETYIFVLCGVLGLLEGSATILINVLFLDYLGMRRLVMGLSLWSFSIGIIFLATPPLIGIFKDVYGQYDNIFYLMGSISVFSALLWLIEPSIMNWRTKRVSSLL